MIVRQHHSRALSGELPKRDRIALARRRCRASPRWRWRPTAVRLPPKSAPRASAHHRACTWTGIGHGRGKVATTGVIVATYGILSITPESTAETPRISIVVDSGSPPVTSSARRGEFADHAGLHQRADHDEQAGEEQQRLPFHAGEVVGCSMPRNQDQDSRHPAAPRSMARCASPDGAMNAAKTRTSTTPAFGQQRRIADGLALSSDITSATRSGWTPKSHGTAAAAPPRTRSTR